MRILITSLPGYGHLCPLIPLAHAIKSAGHQVAIATSSSCAEFLSVAGIQLLSSGPVWHESQFNHEIDHPHENSGESRLLNFLNTSVYPKMLRDVQAHVRNWQPDILLSNDYDSVGRTVAESENLLFAMATHGARMGLLARQEMLARISIGARKICGLPNVAKLEYPFRWLHLNFAPSCYSINENYAESDNEHSLRPEIYDQIAQGNTLSKVRWKSEDDNRPIVLCTLGTVFNKNAEFFRALFDAFKDRSYRVLLTLGPSVDVKSLGDMPENVEAHAFLRLSETLPEVDCCVCHGGTSTMSSILLQGKPVLVIPQGADQFLNAIACNQFGNGIGLAGSFNQFSPLANNGDVANLATSIERLINEEGYRNRSKILQKTIMQLPNMQYAVALLEQLHLTGMPVTK